jgi:hypothetical protein
MRRTLGGEDARRARANLRLIGLILIAAGAAESLLSNC